MGFNISTALKTGFSSEVEPQSCAPFGFAQVC